MNSADLIYAVQTFMMKDTNCLITSNVDDSDSCWPLRSCD